VIAGVRGVARRAASRALAGGAAVLGGGESALADARRALAFLRGRLEFRPRADDVYVVSYPRSGTTWMQLMLHRLVGRDELGFTHISEVSPWFERSLAVGALSAPDFERFASPRILKSHLPYGWLPRPGRCVYLVRDGRDVAVSYYHFYRSHLGFAGDFSSFFGRFLRGDVQYRSWFRHVAGWTAHASDPEVLIVRYEALQADRAAVLRQVAAHIGVEVSEPRLARIVAETSFEAMKAHESKFDHATALLLERRLAPRAFLRNGRTGDGAGALNPDQLQAFERRLRAAGAPSRELRISAFLH
jgi:hypothetical protein